jgi:hypothetical protein
MPRFRFDRDTLADGFPATVVVETRAELLASIRRNIVYLRDLTEPDLLIAPAYGRLVNGVPTAESRYLVQVTCYGVVGALDGPL